MKKHVIGLIASGMCISYAYAQETGMVLEVSNAGFVSPSSPFVTIDAHATVDSSVYAFAFAGFVYTRPENGSSGPYNQLLPSMGIPGYPHIGETSAPGGNIFVTTVGQSNFASAPANPASPIHLMSFDWSTTDFTPREVEISFSPIGWAVYDVAGNPNPTLLPTFPGTQYITIQIIPAPTTSLAFLGAVGALGMRRRR